ncbi:unnamed protein product [Anisakis simplex]|uniref:Uncharacterized protein n=1 Tax=Anisakis simplex TaxID=6269 RepID=A0A0M3K0K5_ANISI|nr:unnamed protein product [Anisakis simplex]
MYHQATMAQSQPILTGTFVPSGMPSSGSVPQLSNNVYGTQMSTCCSYPSSATGGCGGIVTGDCAPYEMIPSMSNAPMLAMNGSMQDAHQRSAAMMQRQQHWSSTQDFIYQQPSQTAVFQQAMVSSNALPSPSMKTSSPLKRKPVSAMSQSNVNIPTTNPSTTNELPPKFVHVNQQSAHQQQYPTLYQLSSSANSSNQSASPQQYPQQQQQQSAVSPQQYPTQSPNAVSRLSPYGGYDASQNGTCSLNTSVGGTGSMGPPPTQWSKRGAGAEMIRMDIRQHSVPGALPNYSSPMMPSSTTPPQLQSTPPSNQLLQQHNASLSNTGNATSNGNQPIIVIQSQTLEQVPNQLSNGYYVTSSSPLTTNLSPQNYYSTGMPTAINDPMNSANALTQQTSMIPTELYDFNLGNGGVSTALLISLFIISVR